MKSVRGPMRTCRFDRFGLAALCLILSNGLPEAGRADALPGKEISVPTADLPERPVAAAPTVGLDPDPWRFTVAGWGWLPNAPAEIKLGPTDTTLPENFGTILDSLQYGAFLDFEVRKSRFGVFFAPIVISLKDSVTVDGPFESREITIKEKVFLADFGLSFELCRWQLWDEPDRFLAAPMLTLEPFVGGRTLVDDFTIDIDPGPDFEPELEFIAPIFGLRASVDWTERWNSRLEFDYGGFGVDHLTQTWNIEGVLGYRFKPREDLNVNLFAGYRHLRIHYDNIADIQVTVGGPVIGVAFEFAANGSGFVSPNR